MYAVAVVFSYAVVALAQLPLPSIVDVLRYLLFLQDTTVLGWQPILNGPLWTIPMDIAFYLLLPIFFAGITSLMRARSREHRINGLVVALAAITAGSLLYRFVEARHFPQAMQSFDERGLLIRNAFGLAGTFAAGIGLALLSLLRRGTKPLTPTVVGGALGISALFAVIVSQISWGSSSSIWRPVFSDLAATISVSLIIIVFADGQITAVNRLAQSKFVHTIAAILRYLSLSLSDRSCR